MNTFSEKLKQARADAGMSQAKMSEKMEIPIRTVENWESGKREPPAYVQKMILNELANLVGEGD